MIFGKAVTEEEELGPPAFLCSQEVGGITFNEPDYLIPSEGPGVRTIPVVFETEIKRHYPHVMPPSHETVLLLQVVKSQIQGFFANAPHMNPGPLDSHSLTS
jgi:hypothetical protein